MSNLVNYTGQNQSVACFLELLSLEECKDYIKQERAIEYSTPFVFARKRANIVMRQVIECRSMETIKYDEPFSDDDDEEELCCGNFILYVMYLTFACKWLGECDIYEQSIVLDWLTREEGESFAKEIYVKGLSKFLRKKCKRLYVHMKTHHSNLFRLLAGKKPKTNKSIFSNLFNILR